MVDGAVSLAAARAAHLNAVSVGYEAASIGLPVDGGAAVAAVFEVEHERALRGPMPPLPFLKPKRATRA